MKLNNPQIVGFGISNKETFLQATQYAKGAIIGSAFMGVTMGCARCHDHKLDPFSQEDYYSLQAFMAGTQEKNHLLGPKEVVDAWHETTNQLNEEIAEATKKKDGVPEQKTRLASLGSAKPLKCAKKKWQKKKHACWN